VCAGCDRVLDHPTQGPVCAECWRLCAAGIYDGALRNVIHAFKYDGRRSLAIRLAALMRERSPEVLDGAQAVVPVPLHPSRRRTRGFNQAEDLARHLRCPVVRALRRTKATATQAELPATERTGNVRDAFAPTAKAGALRGKIVVLVDDVTTTGATLESCAMVLRACGVSEVRTLTAARAVLRAGS
jgi:ComF family protein